MLNGPYYIGELHLKDESTPDKVSKLIAGDVVNIDHGSYHSFTTPNKARSKNKIINCLFDRY
jgi:hypothetical protein